jgi:hypothetical protein
LPTVSIDTFFACSLLVSVAIIATAFLAGAMQTQISNMQDLNQQDFLQSISDHIVSGYGTPENWGSTSGVPTTFGLSHTTAQGLVEVDGDKISRLNSQNSLALPYFEAFQASKLNNIAFGVSVSPLLQVQVNLFSSVPVGDVVDYTFSISVSRDSGPVVADLRVYGLAANFTVAVSGVTSDSGMGYVTVEIPNSYSGPGMLVAFARASFDERLTAFAVCSFARGLATPLPNLTYMALSPLNYELNATAKNQNTTVSNVYAFSFAYQSNLTSAAANMYTIPQFVDISPTILAVQGTSNGQTFIEWVAYPQIPLDFGADLSHSESNVFVYPVTINGCLYKLTMRFGDVLK